MSFSISESPVGEWLDNPIFMKHVRSRLRPVTLGSGMLVVLLLGLSSLAIGFEYGGFSSGLSIISLLVLEAVILGIMGASQIALAVGGARSTGILEFHRISPLSSAELTFGFLFGGPIREYVLFAVTLPFVGVCAFMGVPTVRGTIQLVIMLIASSLVLHSLAIASSLLSRRAMAGRGATALIVLICILIFPSMLALMRFLRQLDVDARIPFFGREMPWLGFVLMNEAAFFLFVMLACLRRMRSDQIHPLSKTQAIACVATIAVLLLGALWDQVEVGLGCVVLLYALTAVSITMLIAVTPTRVEYTKGLLRARRESRTRLPWWHDLAWNRGFLLVVCVIIFVAASVGWKLSHTPQRWPPDRFVSIQLAIANAVLIVAYTGLGLQYFLLRFSSRGHTFAVAFFFLIWGLPMFVGAMVAASSISGPDNARVFLAMSPIAGLAFSAGPVPDHLIERIQFAALCPTLLYTFVLSVLAVSARRRIDREVRSSFEADPQFGTAADHVLKTLVGSADPAI